MDFLIVSDRPGEESPERRLEEIEKRILAAAPPQLGRAAMSAMRGFVACSHCGHENRPEAKFCSKCGQPLGQS